MLCRPDRSRFRRPAERDDLRATFRLSAYPTTETRPVEPLKNSLEESPSALVALMALVALVAHLERIKLERDR